MWEQPSRPIDTSRIDNPFRHLKDREVDAVVDRLIKGCDDGQLGRYKDTLLKAARILHDPYAWEHIDHTGIDPFTPVEKLDLEREESEARDFNRKKPPWKLSFWRKDRDSGGSEAVTDRPSGFWHMPKELRTTVITLCVAAVVQGWTQTGMNGANLTWMVGTNLTKSLDMDNDLDCDPQGRTAWIFAIVNAAPWFSAAIFALLISDPANEILFGRRAALCMSAVFILGSSIGGALVRTWEELLICRILLGIGMGSKASVVPVFAAEVAPARMRGSIVMNWQLFDACGIMLGFAANLMVSPIGDNSWRWMTASAALPTIVLFALVMVACPESPRFLMSRGRYLDAFETFTRLRGSRILAAKELVYTHYQLQVEQGIILGQRSGSDDSHDSERGVATTLNHQRPSFLQKLGQLFSVRRNRNALVTAIICMVSQQMCGINVIIFYSATLYADSAGSACRDLKGPLLMSLGIGVTNFIFTFPAYWLIDKKGRRWLLLVTLPFLFVFMGAAALTYVTGRHNALLGVFSYLFVAVYAFGLGPVPFTISAEVFSLDHRVLGMSFAVCVNFFGAGLLTLFVPVITASRMGHGGLLGLFAGLNVVAFVLISYFVRETVGAADADNPGSMTALVLEELYKIFDLKTSDVMAHQTTRVLPWTVAWFGWWCWPFAKSEEGPQRPRPLYLLWEEHNKRPNGNSPDDGADWDVERREGR